MMEVEITDPSIVPCRRLITWKHVSDMIPEPRSLRSERSACVKHPFWNFSLANSSDLQAEKNT